MFGSTSSLWIDPAGISRRRVRAGILARWVRPDSPEYNEIKGNFAEVLAKVFIYDNPVSSNGNNNSEVAS